MSLPDNPKEALAAFLVSLHDRYYVWYSRSTKLHYEIWLPLHLASLLIGAATALVAALAPEESLKTFGTARILLIVLPVAATALSTITAQSRLHQRYQLREDGRRKVQNLLNEGRRRFAGAKEDAEYGAIHKDLEVAIDEIEKEQSASFFLLSKSEPPRTTGT